MCGCGWDLSLLLLPLLTSLGVFLPCSGNSLPMTRAAITMVGILGATGRLAELWRRRFLALLAVCLAVSTAVSIPDAVMQISSEILKYRLGGGFLHDEGTAALKAVGLDTLADTTSNDPGNGEAEGAVLGYVCVLLAHHMLMWWSAHKAWREAWRMGLRLPMGVCSCSAYFLVFCFLSIYFLLCGCCAWPSMLHGVLDVRATGLTSLSSGEMFAMFDAWGQQDGIITSQDMDAMVTRLGAGVSAPWGHFLCRLRLCTMTGSAMSWMARQVATGCTITLRSAT